MPVFQSAVRSTGARAKKIHEGKAGREVQISKGLSTLLRHRAEIEGLKLGPGGYVNVQDVVSFSFIRCGTPTYTSSSTRTESEN